VLRCKDKVVVVEVAGGERPTVGVHIYIRARLGGGRAAYLVRSVVSVCRPRVCGLRSAWRSHGVCVENGKMET
jgi:hypothetical protein